MTGKFENVVIVSDIDGTYYAIDEEGTKRNREKIEYFKANGGRFTFATGRNIPTMLLAEPDAKNITNLPIITCNGACMYDLCGGRGEIAVHTMKAADVYELFEAFNRYNESPEYLGAFENKVLFFKKNGIFQKDIEEYFRKPIENNITEIATLDEWSAERKIYKALIIGNAEAINRIRPTVAERFFDRMEITQSTPTYYEFNAKDVSKARTIKEMLGMTDENKTPYLVVAGDYYNDVEMLKIADLACCPENAVPTVKEICHKTFCHHRKGLIGDMVDYLDSVF